MNSIVISVGITEIDVLIWYIGIAEMDHLELRKVKSSLRVCCSLHVKSIGCLIEEDTHSSGIKVLVQSTGKGCIDEICSIGDYQLIEFEVLVSAVLTLDEFLGKGLLGILELEIFSFALDIIIRSTIIKHYATSSETCRVSVNDYCYGHVVN